MRRCAFSLLFGLAVAFSCGASDWSFALASGVCPQLGAAYNGSFDFGLSGGALEILGQAERSLFAAEIGIESGASPIGWQVLFPVRGGIRWGAGSLHGLILAETSPGLSLTRPVLFMIGLGALARVDWEVSSDFGLYLSVGARWTLCPAYASFTGAGYQSVDIPVSLGVRWVLAR